METIETLAARIERLERIHEERVTERPSMREDHPAHGIWDRISFGAWLKISGPTFAVMTLGFGVLWNSQQQTTQRILDLEESTTERILRMQERILSHQQTTTDRIFELQQQILDLHRESREG